MHQNPFSPSFAMLPSSFFGRTSYIEAYGRSLDEAGSAGRFFFLTGTRGSGKTSLLHQYELQATTRHWDVLRATSIDVLDRLLHYAGLDATITRSKSLDPSVSIAGIGSASIGNLGMVAVEAPKLHLLGEGLQRKLRSFRVKNGLAIIVDESQKLKNDDAVILLNAVQDAKASGLPISLVLCGLPNTYNRVRSFSDVTFVRRMRREKLWSMSKGETLAFLSKTFAQVPEISLTSEQIARLGSFSGGHPYLLQLLGDHLYRIVDEEFSPLSGEVVAAPDWAIELAESRSLVEYKENVLDDVLKGTHPKTREYIRVAYSLRDQTGLIETARVNERFGKTAQELSTRRASALSTQVIRDAGRGALRFALPHCQYLFEAYDYSESEVGDDDWEL